MLSLFFNNLAKASNSNFSNQVISNVLDEDKGADEGPTNIDNFGFEIPVTKLIFFNWKAAFLNSKKYTNLYYHDFESNSWKPVTLFKLASNPNPNPEEDDGYYFYDLENPEKKYDVLSYMEFKGTVIRAKNIGTNLRDINPYVLPVIRKAFKHQLSDIGLMNLHRLERDLLDRFKNWNSSGTNLLAQPKKSLNKNICLIKQLS